MRWSSRCGVTRNRRYPRCDLTRMNDNEFGAPWNLKARHPTIQWRQMADAGNKYRHDYEDVAHQVVWATVQDALPPLRGVISAELASCE
jgi:uncharacterized protein with HEPN domain